ncbi:MAG: hypothetical protein AAF519_11670, partial [Bacteroidota bacterium]
VFLDTAMSIIIERLAKTNMERPKLKDLDLGKTLKDTYQIRKPFYVRADYTLEGEKVNEKELIQLIARL